VKLFAFPDCKLLASTLFNNLFGPSLYGSLALCEEGRSLTGVLEELFRFQAEAKFCWLGGLEGVPGLFRFAPISRSIFLSSFKNKDRSAERHRGGSLLNFVILMTSVGPSSKLLQLQLVFRSLR